MCYLNFQKHTLPIDPIQLGVKNTVLSGTSMMDARFDVKIT
jgi:hypothetical protein